MSTSAVASYHVYLEYPILVLLLAGLVAGRGSKGATMPGLVMLAVLGALLVDAAPQKSDSTSWGYVVLIAVAVVVVGVAVVVLLRRRRR